jgi:probable HAF family extracellular repeat protein
MVTSREHIISPAQATIGTKGADMRLKRTMFWAVLCVAVLGAAFPALAQTSYQVETLPNLGGANAVVSSINNRGWAGGAADFAGDNVSHAALWMGTNLVDLGSFGGSDINSAIGWGVKADNGVLVGISDTTADNPLGEYFSCWAFYASGSPTGKICNGFRWQNGSMMPLPPFPGGYNSYAAAANNRGQIVGWAENGVNDASCVVPFQVRQFRAVIWQPDGTMQELPPLPGDSTSAATAINDLGQVVGISGSCDVAIGRFSARRAVLWDNGVPTDLGSLGGVAWNTATAINNHGVVVGFSNLPPSSSFSPGARHYQAFIWTKATGMQSLGTRTGDVRSVANDVNDSNQVIGTSRSASGLTRAFLWQNGVMTDLNTVTAAGSPFLLAGDNINDRGEVGGYAYDPNTGDLPAYVAFPGVNSGTSAGLGMKAEPEVTNKIRRARDRFDVDDDQ